MKGATTDPWVNTISAPISTIVMINGANQYFLRTRRKSQTSLVKSRKASIELKLRCRSKDPSEINARCMALFPVSGQLLAASTQRVIARQAHHKRNRLKHQQKHGPKNDVAVKPPQGMAQGHPPLVGLPQRARSD